MNARFIKTKVLLLSVPPIKINTAFLDFKLAVSTLQFSLNPSHREMLHCQDGLIQFTDSISCTHVIGWQTEYLIFTVEGKKKSW